MMQHSVKIEAAGLTDVGRLRTSNEDALGVFTDRNLFIVADGMGGHAAGEVASRMAVDTIRSLMQSDLESPRTSPADLPVLAARLIQAHELTNQKIYEAGRASPQLNGMGTTVISMLTEGRLAHVAHVGDSRLYLARDGRIEQVTRDHSLINDYIQQGILTAEQAERHPLKHVITRALGSSATVTVDYQQIPLQHEDLFLLCSDGLSNLLSSDEILDALKGTETHLVQGCRRLIEQANRKGGDDNITVILVRCLISESDRSSP
jgi:protein phosphatase